MRYCTWFFVPLSYTTGPKSSKKILETLSSVAGMEAGLAVVYCGKDDLKIALHLGNPVEEVPKWNIRFPKKSKGMSSFKSLWERKVNSDYGKMWKGIPRFIALALALQEKSFEDHMILGDM
ncbi:hypothetical protein DFH28DRAFT_927034 [Melampsora americana]|nr:hypothetical protein DFH28DRAFT_927034 [Melampsora americana]